MRGIWIVILLINWGFTYAQNNTVTLWGNAPGYSNMHLTIERESNYITRSFQDLATFTVDPKGNFSASFAVEEITKIYISLGELRGHLYVEPGKTYLVTLPLYRPLKPEDKLNPFFTPGSVVLGVQNSSPQEINRKTTAFEEKYNYLFNKNIKRIILTGNKKDLFKIIDEIDVEFPAENGSWFYYYKHFKYQNLYEYAYSSKPRRAIHNGFSTIPVLYNLDTYWASFNRQFNHFFHYYLSSKEGQSFKNTWNKSESFKLITRSLSQDTLFKNRELAELIILKNLYTGYFSNKYSKLKITNIVKSAKDSCVNDENNRIASEILDKITKLNIGEAPPAFELENLSGSKTIVLQDYKGKFVYLNFANTKNYACKKDFQVLEQMAQTYKKDMEIVTILTDEDPDEAMEYVKNNKFSWHFLHFGQNAKILLDYNIKALPTYYLINPEGNMVLSPAPSPEENFAEVFAEIYNNFRRKQLRKNKPKNRTIYDL
ncbi:TlpA family protein disulfide reductase [Saccharicrinis fermentans]|uniref:TlpA family protein disulfide reductase n=1 Tax=Saccharicrinis fermentans TaxID=982 RepID=UPI000480D427|nr:TlpA disulfide reductase family protein [Saccharicrinis fermentans]